MTSTDTVTACASIWTRRNSSSDLSLDEPKQGTEVVAKIACGRRSMAYCLFHELIEWVQIRLFSF